MVKFANVDGQFTDASMADFPILRNFLGTHASPGSGSADASAVPTQHPSASGPTPTTTTHSSPLFAPLPSAHLHTGLSSVIFFYTFRTITTMCILEVKACWQLHLHGPNRAMTGITKVSDREFAISSRVCHIPWPSSVAGTTAEWPLGSSRVTSDVCINLCFPPRLRSVRCSVLRLPYSSIVTYNIIDIYKAPFQFDNLENTV
jgi:hypothetical protein